MLVGDLEPTSQRQKLLLPTRQSFGAKWVRELGGWEKTNKSCCSNIEPVQKSKTSKWEEKQKRKKSGNRPDPKESASQNHSYRSATLPLCHYAIPLLRYSVTAVLIIMLAPATLGSSQAGTSSVLPVSMKYQYISIELCAIGVAKTAPKVQGVAA